MSEIESMILFNASDFTEDKSVLGGMHVRLKRKYGKFKREGYTVMPIKPESFIPSDERLNKKGKFFPHTVEIKAK